MAIGESPELQSAQFETKKVLLDLIVEVAGKINRLDTGGVQRLAAAYALVVRPDRGNSQS